MNKVSWPLPDGDTGEPALVHILMGAESSGGKADLFSSHPGTGIQQAAVSRAAGRGAHCHEHVCRDLTESGCQERLPWRHSPGAEICRMSWSRN